MTCSTTRPAVLLLCSMSVVVFCWLHDVVKDIRSRVTMRCRKADLLPLIADAFVCLLEGFRQMSGASMYMRSDYPCRCVLDLLEQCMHIVHDNTGYKTWHTEARPSQQLHPPRQAG